MLEDRAREFATQIHKGQMRKDGTPYITHPEAVVNLLKSVGVDNEDTLAAGWLHDVMEDCGVSLIKLSHEFNPNIAGIVLTLTQNIERGPYKRRIAFSDYPVKIIKLADTVHNCQTLHPSLPDKTIRRKVQDCENFYLDLAERTCPELGEIMKEAIVPYVRQYGCDA